MRKILAILALIAPLGMNCGCKSNEQLAAQLPLIIAAMQDAGVAGTVDLRIVPRGGFTITGPGVAMHNDSEITVHIQVNMKGP